MVLTLMPTMALAAESKSYFVKFDTSDENATLNGRYNSTTTNTDNSGRIRNEYIPTNLAHADGYTFAGWFTAIVGGTEVDVSNTVFSSHTFLYAHWEDAEGNDVTPGNAGTCNIMFIGNGGRFGGAGSQRSAVTRSTDGYSLPEHRIPPIPEREGYTFAGWYTDDIGGTLVAVEPNAIFDTDMFLFAHWTKQDVVDTGYDVTFSMENDRLYAVITSPHANDTNNYWLKVSNEAGNNGTTTYGKPGEKIWIGCSFSSDLTKVSITTKDNTQTTLLYKTLDKPIRAEVSKLTGVSAETRHYLGMDKFGTKFTGLDDAYTHYYISNGPYLEGDMIWLSYPFGNDSSDTVPFELTGFKWTETDEYYLCSSASCELLIPWTGDADYFTVSLDSNGGSLSEGTKNNIKTGAGYKLTSLPTPTKEGYAFKGWYDAPEGGNKITTETVFTENTTVYAQWGVARSVYFVSNDTTVYQTQTVAVGEPASKPTNPTRSGYTFAGWYTDTDRTVAYDFSTPVTEDIYLYAKWTQNSGSVTPAPNRPIVPPVIVEPTTPSNPTQPTQPEKTEETIVTESPNGVEATTTVNSDGIITEVKAEVPSSVAINAAVTGEAVQLPMEPVANTTLSFLAPTITVNTNCASDIPVEIPVIDPTPGTVVIIVNADGSETVVATSSVTADGVVANLPDGATIKVVDNAMSFKDVNDGDWSNDAIAFVSARGILTGTGDGEFGKSETTSRAMVWTMLARLSGVDTTGGENWYSVAQEWAIANGISDGSDASGEITREQLVTMLWRYTGEPNADASLTDFNDAGTVSSWSQTASQWAVENSVMNGSDGSLNPQGITTRDQLAQFVMNFINNAI